MSKGWVTGWWVTGFLLRREVESSGLYVSAGVRTNSEEKRRVFVWRGGPAYTGKTDVHHAI